MSKKAEAIIVLGFLLVISLAMSVSAVTTITQCQTLNNSDNQYVLNDSITSPDLGGLGCLDFGADNLVFDCKGFNITYDTSGEGALAFTATGRDKITIKNCNLIDARGIAGADDAIRFSTTNNSFILNTTMEVRSAGTGISFVGSNNNTVEDVNMTAEVSNVNAISLNNANDNKFINFRLNISNGTSQDAFVAFNSNNTQINDSFFHAASLVGFRWIAQTASIGTNFTNQIYATTNGSIQIFGTTELNNTNITIQNLNITNNVAFLQSSNITELNVSARVTLRNLPFTPNIVRVDEEDDGTFIDCPGSQCTVESATFGTLVFNVTQFTTYSAGVGCGEVTTSLALTGDVTSAGTCFNITADDVTLDCAGFRVTYNTGGEANSRAVYADSVNNMTVKSCDIQDITAGGQAGIAMRLLGINNSVIFNNTIQTNGTRQNFGIDLLNSAANNNVSNNTIRTKGATDSNWGLRIAGSGNTVLGNIIITNGTSSNFGIIISSDNNTIIQNDVTTLGTGGSNQGIRITSDDNLVLGNIVNTTGTTSCQALLLQGSEDNNISSNIFTVSASDSDGIFIQNNNFNNVLFNNTITAPNFDLNLGGGANNLNTTLLDQVSLITNYTLTNSNLIIEESNLGILRFINTFSTTGTNLSSDIIITNNSVFVNSTRNTDLNISAQLTLFNINFLDPKAQVDVDDDGTFADCGAACTEESFTSSTFVFNVTSFTTYQAAEGAVLCGSNLTSSATMILNLTISSSDCLNIISDDVVLDCAGFTITYDDNGESSNTAGIRATGRTNVTIKNCALRDQVLFGGTQNKAIWFTNTNNSMILNSTVRAAGSGQEGIYLNNSHNNIIDTVRVNISGPGASGIHIENASGNQIINTNITSFNTAGANTASGVNITGVSSNSFTDTLFFTLPTWIFSNSVSNNFTSTTFSTISGSIKFGGLFQVNGSAAVTGQKMNITNNSPSRAFVNSSDLTFLNTSATITLNNVTDANPQPLVDSNDNGTFEVCSTPQCTEVSFAGGVFVFDVTQFTTYSSNQTTAVAAAPSGSTSSGGGGGSASRYYALQRYGLLRTESLPISDTSGTIKLLSPGHEYTYTLQDTAASTFVAAVQQDSVTLDLGPNKQTVVLKVLETVKHDVDNDGYYDLQIKVLSIAFNGATAEFTPIHEAVPVTSAPAEEPEQQQAEQTSQPAAEGSTSDPTPQPSEQTPPEEVPYIGEVKPSNWVRNLGIVAVLAIFLGLGYFFRGDLKKLFKK